MFVYGVREPVASAACGRPVAESADAGEGDRGGVRVRTQLAVPPLLSSTVRREPARLPGGDGRWGGLASFGRRGLEGVEGLGELAVEVRQVVWVE